MERGDRLHRDESVDRGSLGLASCIVVQPAASSGNTPVELVAAHGRNRGGTARADGSTMFEIWQHIESGQRYLVVVRDGLVSVAAGPLMIGDDPRLVLETHSNQNHNPRALLDIRRAPESYRREFTTGNDGHALVVTHTP